MSDQEKKLTFKLLGDASNLTNAMKGVEGNANGLGSTLAKVGGIVATAFSVTAVIGFGKAIAETGMSFEQQMAKVQAISGASAEDLEKMETEAKRLGKSTKFSATEAGQGLEYFAMAGWSVDDSITALEPTLKLATASGEDLGLVADIVSDAITGFGLSSSDASGFADLLASTSSNANTNVSLLGESFKYVAPVVGALKGSAEDTALALGLMANAGIKGSQAGTSLRSAITNMVDPTNEMKSAMDSVGFAVSYASDGSLDLKGTLDNLRESLGALTPEQQAQAGATIFGKEAMSGMLAIVNATEQDYQKLTEATTNYNGVATEQADIMGNTLEGRITALKSAWEGVQLMLYDFLLPAFEKVVEWLGLLIQWITDLESTIKDKFSSSSDEIGKFKDFFTEVKDNVLTIYENMKTAITEWYEENKEKVDKVKEKFGELLTKVGEVINLILSIIGTFIDDFTTYFLTDAIVIIDGLMTSFNGMIDTIKGVLEIIKGIFTGDWALIWDGFKNVVTGVIDTVKGVFDIFIGKIEAGINGVFNLIDKVKSAFTGATSGSMTMSGTADIPKLANGGIVTSPTLALIGEGAESEAVIPLSKLNQFGGSGTANITVELDGHTLAKAMGQPLVQNIRMQTGLAF